MYHKICIISIMIWHKEPIKPKTLLVLSLQLRYNEWDGVSNHRRLDCLHNRLFWRRSKKTSKLLVTDICEGNSAVTGEFYAQRVEIVSIWWRHYVCFLSCLWE